MTLTPSVRLDNQIRSALPAATGVSIGRWENRASWFAQWPEGYEPSEEERAAAQGILDAFDPAAADDPPAPPDEGQSDNPDEPEAPPSESGASSYPGGALIDQRLSEAAGALTSEYQNRVSQLDPKIGDANARIVALFGKADRTEEETAELNRLYADVNGWTALRSRLTDHYVAMQSAMLQPGFDLAAFDPAYGWPT